MRAVTGRPVHVYFSVEAEDGALTAVDSATTVPVEILDGAGNTVSVGAASATTTTGVYKYSVASLDLGVYTATATATVDGFAQTITQTVVVVGTRLVPLSVLRARPALASLSTEEFLRVVDDTEMWVTEMLDYSPVPMVTARQWTSDWPVEYLHVPGLPFPRRLVSLTRDGTAQDLTGLSAEGTSFRYPRGATEAFFSVPTLVSFPAGVYVAVVEHGRWDEVPGDLQRAVAKLADHLATADNSLYPERATRVMTEASEIFFGTPDGVKKLTGLPEVDGVLARYRLDMPV